MHFIMISKSLPSVGKYYFKGTKFRTLKVPWNCWVLIDLTESVSTDAHAMELVHYGACNVKGVVNDTTTYDMLG